MADTKIVRTNDRGRYLMEHIMVLSKPQDEINQGSPDSEGGTPNLRKFCFFGRYLTQIFKKSPPLNFFDFGTPLAIIMLIFQTEFNFNRYKTHTVPCFYLFSKEFHGSIIISNCFSNKISLMILSQEN